MGGRPPAPRVEYIPAPPPPVTVATPTQSLRTQVELTKISGEQNRLNMETGAELDRINDERAAQRKTLVASGDRSAKVRTYNYPQGRITDHRINKTMYNLSSFMNGDIQDMIDALKMAENAEKLKGETE